MDRLTSVQSTVIIYFFPAMSVNFIIGQSHLSPAKLLPARHLGLKAITNTRQMTMTQLVGNPGVYIGDYF